MRGVALDEVLDTFHCPVLLDPVCHSCISAVLVFVHLTPVRVKVAARVGPLNRVWVEYFFPDNHGTEKDCLRENNNKQALACSRQSRYMYEAVCRFKEALARSQ